MNTLQLHVEDNVVIAIKALQLGTPLTGGGTTTKANIAAGHKIASRQIKKGEAVLKYGQTIGEAIDTIQAGEHVHSHNLGMAKLSRKHVYGSACKALKKSESIATFRGYQRSDGRAGTRNYIGVLTTVNCAGTVAQLICERAAGSDWLKAHSNIDGVVPLVHNTGCGMSSGDEGYDTLHRTLSGYARHPNFGAILLVGLGCEVMQVSALTSHFNENDQTRFRYMTIQENGGTRQTVERGLALLRELASTANATSRSPVPASSLVVGMQCGGSDGYSGLSANPALGVASDLLVQQGGTTLLSETPEIFGAEHLLTSRAVSQQVGEKLIQRLCWWENYCTRNNTEMNNNPSPGNKVGGLTTILEKSLGAVAKAGSAPLSDVILYAEEIQKKGLVFMDSPGYDPCSVTGQVASGANLIVFTTGRGSVSGYKPTPCIKLASNTAMFRRLEEDMDLNCGDIIDGTATIESKGKQLLAMMLAIASGTETKSEQLGFGGCEFVPWQMGAVL